MERRLVGNVPPDDGEALALVAEAQAVKPGSPSAIEVPLDADLVTAVLVQVTVDACRFAHLLPSAGLAMCLPAWSPASERTWGASIPTCGEFEVMNLRSSREATCGGRPGLRASARVGCGLATGGRVPPPGSRRTGGCSPRAWRRWPWCDSAPCSATPRAHGRSPVRPDRLQAAAARQAHARSAAQPEAV